MSADEKRSMSDAAIQARTGRTWLEWFAELDAAGAMRMSHPEMATHIHETYGIDGWWSQTVTVEYERARGLRRKHQRPDGFSVSASQVLPAPVERLYEAWADEGLRRQWLPQALTVRKATPHKSLRLTWTDGRTSVEVNLYSRGEARSQASVQHSKLPEAEQVEEMRAFWKAALRRLGETLAG